VRGAGSSSRRAAREVVLADDVVAFELSVLVPGSCIATRSGTPARTKSESPSVEVVAAIDPDSASQVYAIVPEIGALMSEFADSDQDSV